MRNEHNANPTAKQANERRIKRVRALAILRAVYCIHRGKDADPFKRLRVDIENGEHFGIIICSTVGAGGGAKAEGHIVSIE